MNRGSYVHQEGLTEQARPGDVRIGETPLARARVLECGGSRDRDREGITAEDLARTVFSKAGHHASHNATLRALGLERMTSRRLAEFIPVDKQTVDKIGWKKMPFNPLLNRLRERCRRRIVWLDAGIDEDAGPTFRDAIEGNDLYFEIALGRNGE